MDRACRLARWVGEGPRAVTAGEVLRRSDVAVAGEVLGVEVPARVRTAADVPALHRPWSVAVGVGLLTVDGGVVTAGPALQRWPLVDDGELLAGWLAGLRVVCAAESDRRREESVAILVSALLEVIALDRPPAGADLWSAVHSRIHGDPDNFEKFFIGTVDRYLDLDTGDPLAGLFVLLGLFGAVTGGSGKPRITPLGRWAVSRLRAEAPKPADADLTADELIRRLAEFGDQEQVWAAAQPWLAARARVTAAREILAAAAVAPPRLRAVAVEVVGALGEPVLPVWLESTEAPGVGQHARAVLAAWGLRPALDVADRRWLVVEAAAAALAGAGPDEALSRVAEGIPGPDLASRVAAAGASGHPQARVVSEALVEFLASGAPRAVDQVLQLKVTLLRWRPPIWRRVLLPAFATLDELHRVIQALFGWDGDHLHAFEVGRKQYSDPYFELEEAGDEFGLRVVAAFTPPVRSVTYTYDFGAGWRHEIRLEKVIERRPGQSYPVCVSFRGDSPVEYFLPEDPQEPVPFDLAAVNRLLADADADDGEDG